MNLVLVCRAMFILAKDGSVPRYRERTAVCVCFLTDIVLTHTHTTDCNCTLSFALFEALS